MILWIFILTFFCLSQSATAAQKAVVVVPVADLRSDQSLPEPGKADDKQQTQVLLGETVQVVKSSGGWVYINAVEQPEFTTHQKWEGYPGWVVKDAISTSEPIPPRKPRLAKELLRPEIVATAERLLGTPYVWGGLSSMDPNYKPRLSGLDCSGLTHLAYRSIGVVIPRDSMEQYMLAKKIRRADLKSGDLIFSAKADTPKKITHVTLYAGKDQLLEAPQTGMVVRQVSFKEKYGADLSSVESGDTVGDRVIYFGRYLKD